MNVLAVVVALLAVVTALNLFILLGVVRRLREMSASAAAAPVDDGLPEPGTAVGGFIATTPDGGTVTEADLATGRSLVVLLTPTCAPCRDTADRLVAQRDRLPANTFVLVDAEGDEPELAPFLEKLAGVRTVAVLAPGTSSHLTFGTEGFPTSLVIEDGRLSFASFRLGDALKRLPDRALATPR